MKNLLSLLLLVVIVPVLALGGWDLAASELSAPSTIDNLFGVGLAFGTFVICLWLVKNRWRSAWASVRSLTDFRSSK